MRFWLECPRSFIFLKYLEDLSHNSYLEKTSWKHRESLEKQNWIYLSCILCPGPFITGLEKNTYRSRRERAGRSKGRRRPLSCFLGYCCAGIRTPEFKRVHNVYWLMFGSLEDTNMFSCAFELVEMLFCLLLLHGSNLESFSPVKIGGEEREHLHHEFHWHLTLFSLWHYKRISKYINNTRER